MLTAMQGNPHIMPVTDPASTNTQGGWLRKLPFLAILLAAVAGAVFFRDQLSFETLAQHREALVAFRDAHYIATVLTFLAAYVAIVALSLPGGTVATLTGGFLFGVFPGVLFNVLGAGIGAMLVFLAARSGFGASVSARIASAGGVAARLQTGLRENEWSVLFLMRIVPAVPFVLANLIPAFVGTSLFRFAVSTFVGIIPGALVFTSVGSGLGEVFARGETPDLGLLFTPAVLGPILGLAALAALPMVLRVFKRTR
jgi:uncharacterized membrane protein YdjX (TVP38/TMEM64 family)